MQLKKENEGLNIVVGTHGTALGTMINYYDTSFGYEQFWSIVDRMPYIMHFQYQDAMQFYEVTEQDKELMNAALKALECNFDDGVYHHTVGSAIRCKSGNTYTGVNCDGIHGSCADVIGLLSGCKGDFE